MAQGPTGTPQGVTDGTIYDVLRLEAGPVGTHIGADLEDLPLLAVRAVAQVQALQAQGIRVMSVAVLLEPQMVALITYVRQEPNGGVTHGL